MKSNAPFFNVSHRRRYRERAAGLVLAAIFCMSQSSRAEEDLFGNHNIVPQGSEPGSLSVNGELDVLSNRIYFGRWDEVNPGIQMSYAEPWSGYSQFTLTAFRHGNDWVWRKNSYPGIHTQMVLNAQNVLQLFRGYTGQEVPTIVLNSGHDGSTPSITVGGHHVVTSNGTAALGNVSATGAGNNYFASNVGIKNSSPLNTLSIGDVGAGQATATPDTIGLGSTYGNQALGKNLKLKLYQSTLGTNNDYGLGISNALMEFTTAQAADFAFFSNGTTPTELLRIKASGNVGIGTSIPSSVLHLYRDTNANVGVKIENPNVGTSTSMSFSVTDGTKFTHFGQDGNGTYTNRKSQGYIYNNGAGVGLYAVGTSGAINFYTGGENHRMTVHSNGNVGIGNSTPGYPLVVNKGSAGFEFDALSQTIGTTWGTGGGLMINSGFAASTAGSEGAQIYLGGSTRGDDYRSAVVFRSNGVEYMRVDGASEVPSPSGHTAGNVGIGTNRPRAKLHVAGTTRFEGRVRIEPQGDISMGEFTTDPAP